MQTKIVLAVHCGKGGVSKSTTSWALSSYLSTRSRTLAVDSDSQGTLTNALVTDLPKLSTYHVLRKQAALGEAAVNASQHYPDNLKLIAGGSLLANLELETAGDLERPYLLSDALGQDTSYEVTVIDTAPSPGVTTVCALVASTHVLCPVLCEPTSLEQLQTFETLLAQIKKRLNRSLEWVGILPARFDARNNLDVEVLEELRGRYGANFVFSPVRSTVRLREAMAAGHAPWRQPSTDYLNVTNDLLRRLGIHDQEISNPGSGNTKGSSST